MSLHEKLTNIRMLLKRCGGAVKEIFMCPGAARSIENGCSACSNRCRTVVNAQIEIARQKVSGGSPFQAYFPPLVVFIITAIDFLSI